MSQDQHGDLSAFSMLDLFRMEADSQTQILTDGLLAMERHAGDAAAVEAMMRAAHSIKGAAAIVGLQVVVQLAHGMEDSFVAAQHGRLKLTPERVDVLLSGVDLIVQLSRLDDAGAEAWLAANAAQIDQTLNAIAGIAELPELPALPSAPAPMPAPAAATPQAPVASGLAVEEPEAAAPAPRTGAAPAKAPAQNFDKLLSLASESRINAHQMHPFIGALQRFKRNQSSLFSAIEHLHEAIARAGDAGLMEKSLLALQKTQPLKQFMLEHIADIETYERRLLAVSQGMVDEVLALRMRPFRDGIHAFPRMVRDLARSLGKEVQLEIEGEDTLVDRDILAKIESPLNHMLRNAIDHGMEGPYERIDAGKEALGTIRMEARHRAGMLSIEISDDGRGVDLEKIRQSVIERKMASPVMAAALSPGELLEFLFLPAFSLKEKANQLSGRGVGLDIVHETIRQQNGTVRLESEPGRGFRALITLPLTQSIVRALVIDIQGEAYAIPIVKVESVVRVPQAAIHTLENKQFFELKGEHLGLVSAAQVLELGEAANQAEDLPVVVIGRGKQSYALVVDAIRGEQSLAVQAIDPIFGKMRDISAAALLDDGEPVLILDVPDLLLSIDKLLHEGGLHQLAQAGHAQQRRAKRILVVDDSLTVREMERKLLLARGFEVDVAIDGIDGWNVVRSGEYDLVITDVDMPRMDGIELVSLIKKDLHLHKLPVMIVSYKDRPEDRARGLSAGADYYLTKGSFHDETLLDAVADLIGDARL
ncbi:MULTISPECIES: hybrid sensor histidine kinase/response regulator [Janthinobacterium]|uniref:hybrid sensor histidine kinase/response regulator n=1 Tax=Janthinobacterium TaxID=29580 RepID=UPI000875376A|nr:MULTISPECIES: hybrid sensor histidine kinase/response regulator [Janthinobacterium]MCC7698934.1 hybrid sensor histidine kinase/response regulator [Janthinobacterium sp. EB271-G4-7A]MCC7716890.1 hybrid sensor histidine kinase/response regulator [Janthinobacterium lividum]OEZ51646.1 chemotaxis protein CheA [Janthinobacterium lividum]WQE30506.1 hybrid sensor histidine kinase/response regulator [Janthinobacterium lividum]SDH87112.1 two-component system, chemotaxis family, sensor histidine kinas